jgi:hypothetical protein
MVMRLVAATTVIGSMLHARRVLACRPGVYDRSSANFYFTVKPVLDDAAVEILAQKQEVLRLKAVADQHPFYKYNALWTRELQNLVRDNAYCVSEYLNLMPVLGHLD